MKKHLMFLVMLIFVAGGCAKPFFVEKPTAAPSPTAIPSPTPPPTATAAPLPTATPAPITPILPKIGLGAVDTRGTKESAIKHTRIVFNWRTLEPTRNSWNQNLFAEIDQMIEDEFKQGRTVVGLLVGTPAWASPDGKPSSLPRGIYLPHNDPQNIWGQFVKEIVGLYRDRIQHWVVWNEPDIKDSNNPYFVFDGTTRDYYQLLKVAYLVSRETNPQNQIHLAGSTYWGDKNYFEKLMNIVANDPDSPANNYFFDVATLNLYAPVRLYYDIPQQWKKAMETRGIYGKQIWVQEANTVPVIKASDDERASWIIQASAMALAGGVSQFSVYRWAELNIPGEDGYAIAGKPASQALITAATYFNGIDSARFAEKNGIYRVEMTRGNKLITVLWNMTAAEKHYALNVSSLNPVLIVDKYGSVREEKSDNKQLGVSLEPARIKRAEDPTYTIGGSPLIIVAEN